MARAIHTVDDWTDEEIDSLLRRAGELAVGAPPTMAADALIGMCFFQTSLRTRVGFEAAALRLGAKFVEVVERRGSTDSMPERIEDTIRVVSGYCDALVVRSPHRSTELAACARAGTTWVNAGDSMEHPTQALIDLFAIEQLVGPIGGVRVALVGDLRMRAAQSLLSLLKRRAPAALFAATAPQINADGLADSVHTVGSVVELIELKPDVVYLVGIPHQTVGEDIRARLRLDRGRLASLSADAVVLSPLPLIDEIASNARPDRRIKWFEQSDLGLAARIAVLESALR